jgi:hypothetical protein
MAIKDKLFDLVKKFKKTTVPTSKGAERMARMIDAAKKVSKEIENKKAQSFR